MGHGFKKQKAARRGITNVFGAILFVLAIVALTSMIAIVASEYGVFVRSTDYMNTVEREKIQESLIFQNVSATGELCLNITNIGGQTITISNITVHNRNNNTLSFPNNGRLPLVLNPGMTEPKYNITGVDVATSNSTTLIVTSRGNSFLIIVEGGKILFRT